MNNDYFQKVSELEEMNVSDDYIIGWQEGYQHAPKLEEQRLTDAYEAGYEDGENNNIEKKEVKIGVRNEGLVEVLSGLDEGDTIVAAGLKKVNPKGKIKPISK